MTSLFESTFSDRVIPAAERAFGVTVTLTRGHSTTAPFTARRSEYEHEVIGADLGFPTKIKIREYRFQAASVVLDVAVREPQEADRITDGTEVFEIKPKDMKTPAVESQLSGAEWVVYTQRIEVN